MYQILLSKQMYDFLFLCLKSFQFHLKSLSELFPHYFSDNYLVDEIDKLMLYLERNSKDIY